MGLFNIFKRKKREYKSEDALETEQFEDRCVDTFEYRPNPNVVYKYWMPNGRLRLLIANWEFNQYDKTNKMFKCQVSMDGEDWHTIGKEGGVIASTTNETLMTLRDCMIIANRVASGQCETHDGEERIGYWRVGIGFGPEDFTTCFSGRIDGNKLFDVHFNDLGRITCHLETMDY